MHRLRSLSLKFHLDESARTVLLMAIGALLTQPAPILTTVRLQFRHLSTYTAPSNLFSGQAPMLHAAMLEGGCLTLTPACFSKLWCLTIRETAWPLSTNCLPFQLKILELGIFSVEGVPFLLVCPLPSLSTMIIKIEQELRGTWDQLWQRLDTYGYTKIPTIAIELEWH